MLAQYLNDCNSKPEPFEGDNATQYLKWRVTLNYSTVAVGWTPLKPNSTTSSTHLMGGQNVSVYFIEREIPSGWSGCPTGNGKKLSSNQVQLGQETCLAVA